jgi:gluconate 2-dehydrogenase gamma chain
MKDKTRKAPASPLISRREFLATSALLTGSAWISLNIPRPLAAGAAALSSERAVLSEDEWKILEAVTAHIIPTDDKPGAIEAGCVNFIDKALANEDAQLAPLYKAGLAALNAVSANTFETGYADADPVHQLTLLTLLEDGKVTGWPDDEVPQQQFFEMLRIHTVIGFLADPAYGGNRDYAGWKMIGYPGPAHHRHGYSAEQMVGKAPVKSAWEK